MKTRWAERHPRLFRLLMNLLPAWRGTGARVTHIADDWSEMRIRLPLGWRTRNYVGTIFGGSLYGAVDPHFMLMLIHRLGPDYVVWDKSATIRFRKPGKTTLTATCRIPGAELAEIRRLLEAAEKADRTYSVDLVDASGTVYATVEKVVQVRRRTARRPSDG